MMGKTGAVRGNYMIARQRMSRERRPRRLPAAAVGLPGCAVRFLLAAVLTGAELLDGRAPFAVAFVAVCVPGLGGAGALLGAMLGYLGLFGLAGGLRYVAACMMVYAVTLATGELSFCRKGWFAPVSCMLLSGMVGFVYQSAAGWSGPAAVGYFTELILTAGAVCAFRLAVSALDEAGEVRQISVRQTVGILTLGAVVLMALARVAVADICSLGRVLAAAAVLIAGWKGGVGVGAAAGVTAGLAMDLALPGAYACTAVYALAGLVSGIFAHQGRLLCALAYCLAAGAALIWNGGTQLQPLAFESVAGVVIFLILPERLLRRFAGLFCAESLPEGVGEEAAFRSAARRLKRTAEAYRAVTGDLAGAVSAARPNDGDTQRIFDRAAEQVCVRCRQRERCWQQEYQSTRAALADALGPMMDRGEGRREDFPAYFADQCPRFDAFLAQSNRELTALFCRRQYDSRVRESRAAVCAQYDQLAAVLDQTAAELIRGQPREPKLQRLVKQRLAAAGAEGNCAVWRDENGHLRVLLTGKGAEAFGEDRELEQLGLTVGCLLRVEERSAGWLSLCQREPLMAVAGVAAANKEGQNVSGDTGAWFKDERGVLTVVLCDGMGSGPEAREDSGCALTLLEKFLRAGLSPETALATVGEALALRGEERGGFTAVDLLRLDLFSGAACVYKLGAAATYVRRGGNVERLEGNTLPAGVPGGDASPDSFPLKLEAGDCVVMVSDGVTDGNEDSWLCELLQNFDSVSPQALAQSLLTASGRRGGRGDDRTVMVLRVDRRGKS